MIRISAEPSYAESLLARAIIAIDQLANPLERAVFRGDLSEIVTDTPPGDRRWLALLLLLTRVERALTEPVLTGPAVWTETQLQ